MAGIALTALEFIGFLTGVSMFTGLPALLCILFATVCNFSQSGGKICAHLLLVLQHTVYYSCFLSSHLQIFCFFFFFLYVFFIGNF